MSRFLTTDIFLTAFNAWAIYFFWRSWRELNSEFGIRNSEFSKWHLTGWAAIALGFLTKGPIALAIPLVAFGALLIFRRKEIVEKKLLFAGLLSGLVVFLILAAPWFLAVFLRVPGSAHFMILGQAAGHLLGTTIKNRHGSFFYFFAILAVGLLPWTILLGWLFQSPKSEIHSGAIWIAISKDGWLLLNVWAIFTFALFSFSQSKLPALHSADFSGAGDFAGAGNFLATNAPTNPRKNCLADLSGLFVVVAREFFRRCWNLRFTKRFRCG